MSTPPTRTRWLIVALIFCMGVLMFIDRVNIAIAAKYIMPEYGLSDVQMGWIFSAFVLGYAVLQIPGGWLGDRFGPRRVLAGAIFWWSAFTAVTAVAGDWFLTSLLGVVGSFIVVRVLIGIGEAAGPPNYNRVVANWTAPSERGLAMGIATSGSALGAALTPPLIVAIMVNLGWRAAFYIAGLVGIVFALVCYWFVTDRPEEHASVNATELRHITQMSGLGSVQSAVPARTPWRLLLGRRDLWLLTASYTVLGYIGYIYFSWFYLYLVNVRGFSVVSASWYSTAPFLISAAVAPLGGWLSDYLSGRFGKRIGRCGLGFAGPLVGAGLIYTGAATPDRYLAVLFLSLGEGALFLSVAAYWATTIDLAKPYAGTVSGFMNMGGNLGGTLSPTLTPLLAQQFGWNSALYVAAALALLGAFFWLGVHPERAIELGEKAAGDTADTEHAHAVTGSTRTK
jgi:ACS family glucarate transporter-like MFS transporter